ncbi:hypothetical protein AALP_AA8G458800 [Arabis alpina]|uniref:Uncharacterized protein n=1 Tax=Arabis alpina TaxID=50452 RepID=A0A087GDP9_ARAAL|nr:hypothetical protein AALP_AA8G458800 [Arabis alpina]
MVSKLSFCIMIWRKVLFTMIPWIRVQPFPDIVPRGVNLHLFSSKVRELSSLSPEAGPSLLLACHASHGEVILPLLHLLLTPFSPFFVVHDESINTPAFLVEHSTHQTEFELSNEFKLSTWGRLMISSSSGES